MQGNKPIPQAPVSTDFGMNPIHKEALLQTVILSAINSPLESYPALWATALVHPGPVVC